MFALVGRFIFSFIIGVALVIALLAIVLAAAGVH